MKLALFGGTFDPVHLGHLAIARAAAKAFDLGLIHFVPAAVPPHKGGRVLSDFRHRYAMLALATAEEQAFLPSLLEADSDLPNYSIQTVRRLKSTLRKSDKLYFLIGIDAFMEISTWRQPVELLRECDFIVASRPDYSLADVGEALPETLRPSGRVLEALRKQSASGTVALPNTTIHLLSGVKEKISSTQIRASASKSVQQLSRYVPRAVAGYIKKEHLYVLQDKTESGKSAKVLSFHRSAKRSDQEQG